MAVGDGRCIVMAQPAFPARKPSGSGERRLPQESALSSFTPDARLAAVRACGRSHDSPKTAAGGA
ncbi:hypothetical protein J1614_007344 [Plenodomus biglobosus]|nr:hypothetical protein J1614_007344 [Plenodomus biglobosus]